MTASSTWNFVGPGAVIEAGLSWTSVFVRALEAGRRTLDRVLFPVRIQPHQHPRPGPFLGLQSETNNPHRRSSQERFRLPAGSSQSVRRQHSPTREGQIRPVSMHPRRDRANKARRPHRLLRWRCAAMFGRQGRSPSSDTLLRSASGRSPCLPTVHLPGGGRRLTRRPLPSRARRCSQSPNTVAVLRTRCHLTSRA